jgi:hypothetical protein
MMIWIIEDEARWIKEAIEAIEHACVHIPAAIEIKTGGDWRWPPILKIVESDGQEKADKHPLAVLPSILILDLFEWGKAFHGKSFYEQLREHEKNIEKRLGAFVIIWSNYWSDPASIDFVKETREKDTRFIALETKAKSRLAEAIKGCIGRIEEEG